jgi:hypothetical protein
MVEKEIYRLSFKIFPEQLTRTAAAAVVVAASLF